MQLMEARRHLFNTHSCHTDARFTNLTSGQNLFDLTIDPLTQLIDDGHSNTVIQAISPTITSQQREVPMQADQLIGWSSSYSKTFAFL